jgi:hypothetical protein
MSTWRLPTLPDGDSNRFNHNFEVNDLQQGLLNLLWQVKTKKDKAHALNGLAYYFKSMRKDLITRGKFPCIQDDPSIQQKGYSKLSDIIQDNPSVQQKGFPKLSDDDDHLEKGSSKLSDSLPMPGEGFPKLYDQNDPESKLLDHKVCDHGKRSSEIFQSLQIDTFLQKERKKNEMSHDEAISTKDASTQTKLILDDFDHHQNYTTFDETNLAYKRHKPLTISTPYEILIPKLSFKTKQTLSILTQDIIDLIWEKYQQR